MNSDTGELHNRDYISLFPAADTGGSGIELPRM